jgi:hypothetical protein
VTALNPAGTAAAEVGVVDDVAFDDAFDDDVAFDDAFDDGPDVDDEPDGADANGRVPDTGGALVGPGGLTVEPPPDEQAAAAITNTSTVTMGGSDR